jgi:hypothetical protein
MCLERIGQVRSRDGAVFWEHFIDTADPSRHVENFIAKNGWSICGNTSA